MYFTFDERRPWSQRVTAALKRRGLVPDVDAEWEKHGPHGLHMPDMVFIGEARRENAAAGEPNLSVLIYPHAVYWTEPYYERWWDVRRDTVTRIPTLATQKRKRRIQGANQKA